MSRSSSQRGYSISEVLIALGLLGMVGSLTLYVTRSGFGANDTDDKKLDRAYAQSYILHQISCSKTLANGPCPNSMYIDGLSVDGRILISSSGTNYPNSNSNAKLRIRCQGSELFPEYSDGAANYTPLLGNNISIPCYPVRIYGIDNNNDIYEINPITKTTNRVRQNVVNPLALNPYSNSLAYDPSREHILFTGPDLNLKCWSKSTNTVTDAGSLGLTSDPANAEFYDNSYWFFQAGSNRLNKVRLNYNAAGMPIVSTTTYYDIEGMNLPIPPATGPNTNGFGDIAINQNTGMLYAYTTRGRFYSINLNGAPTNTFVEIKPGIDTGALGLQITFNTDDNILYGHSFVTGDWYTINLTNGALTSINFVTTPAKDPNNPSGPFQGFRDVGGAAWPKWNPN